ncbi:lanthionine synthetase C family protein [Actinomyces ruminis]
MWAGGSLSHGLAGTAMLYSVLSDSDGSFRDVARVHLNGAVRQLRWNKHAGVMGGACGVLASAQQAGADGRSYRILRRKLTEFVVNSQDELLRQYRGLVDEGLPWSAHDIINGLAGRLRVLLDEPSSKAEDMVQRTVVYLLEHVLTTRDDGLPGWWAPSESQPTEVDRNTYTHGDLNLGLAHGVPGVVASLVSVAERTGVESDVRDAIGLATDWIRSWRQDDGEKQYWPARVPAEYELHRDAAPSLLTRAAWCYGTPGVAVTVMRVGKLLQRSGLVSDGVCTLLSHLDIPDRDWHLDGPTFCHGYAGVIYVLYRCWLLTGDARLRALGNRLGKRLIYDMSDFDAPFVFRHWVPDSPAGWRDARSYRRLDGAGILEGGAGVALVLDAVSNSRPRGLHPEWDRVVGLV